MQATELLGCVRLFAEMSRNAERGDLSTEARADAEQRAAEVFAEIERALDSPVLNAADVDRFTRRLLHTSQHSRCVIWLSGRLQDDIGAIRIAVGLEEFGWNDAVPDEEVGRCSVHPTECEGQHTHDPPVRWNPA